MKYKGNTKGIQRAKRAGDFLVFYSKYKGDAKGIRRAKRAGNLLEFLLKMQRKYKGDPAREARRGFWGIFY